MRWLCGRIMTVALMTTLAAGCGSDTGDSQVFRFVRFDNTGITQADSVSQTSANVDIFQGQCRGGTEVVPSADSILPFEQFTTTTVNAVFRNEEAADMHLAGMVIDVGPNAGRAQITRNPDGNIPGGRCSNIEQRCASDADCQGTVGACTHVETTISNLVLFDFQDKMLILPGTYNITVTFFARDDADRTFETRTGYVVTFDDFNNCTTTGAG